MRKQELMCPARDAVLMATDLYRADIDVPCPAILLRTPYGKEGFANDPLYGRCEALLAAGFIIAVQDCRGTGASQGLMNLNAANEHKDGYDAVEWLAALPECDGSVGMYGLSYFGFTQLAAAGERPPHLKAICPFMTLSQQPFGSSRMQTLNMGHLQWAYGQLQGHAESYMPDKAFREKTLPILKDNGKRLYELCEPLPMDKNPAAQLPGVPLLSDYLDLVRGIESKEFWDSIHCPLDNSRMHVASLHATGWLDVACDATIDNYTAARNAADPYTRENARLLVGPWTHGGELPDTVDGVYFGENASGDAQDVSGMMHRWFDRYMKGADTDCFEGRVRYFVTGSNEWRTAEDWPPCAAASRSFYPSENGQLTETPPSETKRALTVDPLSPAPSSITDRNGHSLMADWSEIDGRPDVLTFRSAALNAPITIAGFVRMALNVTTDVPDADFVCRLTDIDASGHATQICAGLLRARHRNGLFHTDFLTPGEETPLEIPVGHGAHCFLPGHRIAIQLTGALYPANNRNLHTRENYGTSSVWQIAHHTLRLGGITPAQLILPVIDG